MSRLLVVVLLAALATAALLLFGPDQQAAPWQIWTARLFLALILSIVIGAERELRHKPAGMRTVTMVGLGACLFTLAGVAAFSTAGDTNSMSRLIQGIVTGIGFLGAGTIIREHVHVEGLTTAATIWAVAAIGLTCALGEFHLAILGAVAILLVLVALPALEKLLGGGEQFTQNK
jgi:putative Mg2+ transporter-C (MgtC) family protein